VRGPIVVFVGVLSVFGYVASPCRAQEGVRQLRYSGQLVQRDAAGAGVPVRSFVMHAWITGDPAGRAAIFRVDDEGRSALDWTERFGRHVVEADGTLAGPRPRLRYVHLGRPYLLSIPGPLLAHSVALASGATWSDEWDARRMEFTVSGSQRVEPRDCWEVQVSTDVGRWQTLLVQKETDLLVSATLRVFIGQGERFELSVRLEDEELLSNEQAAAAMLPAEALLTLQKEWPTAADAAASGLSPDQLNQVAAALPDLRKLAQGTPWERFVATADSAVTAGRQRAKSVAELADKALGRPAPQFSLTDFDGQPIDRAADAGKVVVLHFWDYRGEPESPFGQVGYLDFLAGKRASEGVKVYGVAVDERAADLQQVAAVRRDVRKFSTQFMRLGYPIALDDGSLLKQFGDPRPLEVPLPLWVVIAPDGTIAHYRTGLYPLDPSRGLEELNAAVSSAIR
jgi:peroxiredoxin